MAEKTSIWASAVMWALCLILVVAALTLGPVYLVHEIPKAAEAGADYNFFGLSYGWSREVLAGIHVLFLAGMLGCASFPAGRRLAGRVTGVSVLMGVLELLLAVAAVWLLGEKARFAPPHMTVAALGALLLLGGVGLNLDSLLQTLMSPKTPVILIFSFAVAVGVVAFALIGLLNVRYYERVDYTRAGRYSLPPATVKLLKELDKEVKVTTLFVLRELADDTLQREATAILEEYARISGRIKVNHIDLRRDVKAMREFSKRLITKALVEVLARQGVKLNSGQMDRFAEWLAKKGEIDRKSLQELEDWLKTQDIKLSGNRLEQLLHWLAEKILKLEENSVVFECPETDRVMKVASYDMLQGAELEPSAEDGEGKGAEEKQPEFQFSGESIFHQALSIVTSTKPVKLYFVVGHGEKPQAVGPPSPMMPPGDYESRKRTFALDILEQGLRRRYYRLETINLADIDAKEAIPEDCDVLVICGPWCLYAVQSWGRGGMRGLSRKEAELVRKYLEGGGRAFIMIDPVGPRHARRIQPLLSVLSDYGVEVNVDHVVFDETVIQERTAFGQVVERREAYPWFMAKGTRDYRTGDEKKALKFHPSIRALAEALVMVVECSEVNTVPVEGVRTTRLLTTSQRAWLAPMTGQSPDPKAKATRALCVAVEKEETGQPVMVVLGSSNVFIEPIIRSSQIAANEEFAQRMLAWLAGSAEQLGIAPRPTEATYGKADASAIRTIRFVSVLVLPSVFILAGAVIWLARRK